jgi:hypothetical protein
MTLLAWATVASVGIVAGAVIWTLYVLFDIGSDGLGAGPWHRPQPSQPHSRLPSDFVGLWSLFGSKSIDVLAGSRESAVRRLARLEANIRGLHPDADGLTGSSRVPTASIDQVWLVRRLDELEILAGMHSTPVGPIVAVDSPGGRLSTSAEAAPTLLNPSPRGRP